MKTPLEEVLMNSRKEQMLAYVEQTPGAFEELIQLSLTDRQPYAWRSAWLLWDCMEENDERIKPFVDQIIDVVPPKKDGHMRDLIKILFTMELEEEMESKAYDLAVSVWEQIGKKPATRYNAFRLMVKIAMKYPELAQETIVLAQDEFMDTLSMGVKKSVGRLVKRLLKKHRFDTTPL